MYADGLVQPVMYGMVDSLQPAIGYNWGAGKKSRVRALEKCCLTAAIIISVIAWTVLHTFPRFISSIFIDRSQTALLEMAVSALGIFSFAYVTRWISFTTQSLMLAIEKPKYAALISICTAFIFPVILLLALQGFGLDGIWFNFAGTNILAAILAVSIVVKEWKNLMGKDIETFS